MKTVFFNDDDGTLEALLGVIVLFIGLPVSPAFAMRSNHYRFQVPVSPPTTVIQTPPSSGLQWGTFTGNDSQPWKLEGRFCWRRRFVHAELRSVQSSVGRLLGIIPHRFADRGRAGGLIPQKLATEMETYGQPIIFGRTTR